MTVPRIRVTLLARLAAAATLAATTIAPAAGGAQLAGPGSPPVAHGAQPLGPVVPDVFNGDVRQLPRAPEWLPGDPIIERPRRLYPRGGETAPGPVIPPSLPAPVGPAAPPAEPSRASRVFTMPILNIPGGGFTGVAPPDTVGDVGPNHYVQAINHPSGSQVRVFDKSGNLLAGPVLMSSIVAGGLCATDGQGDPIVLYDGLADRWLLSEFAFTSPSTPPFQFCVYISQTADPTGGYFRYALTTPEFPDYPKYGVWPDAYFISTNESVPAVYALNRTKMIAGQALVAGDGQRFGTVPPLAGFPFQALIPADLDGATPPPAGAPGYFMRHRDTEVHGPAGFPTLDVLEIFEFRPNFANPAASTLTGPAAIAVAEFDSNLCGLTSFMCFPQPGTGVTLDPLREVIMWRLQYRNFVTHETLVGNFATDVNGANRGGIRWFELRKAGAGVFALQQEGLVSPDADNRWMGSIAMDGSGNIALGYSVSSASTFPSIRYTGRLATDPPGTMPQGEGTIFAGTASQTISSRWGDYSAMSVDPSDDCTFWYTHEHAQAGGTWTTRIAAFRFDLCVAPPPPAVTVTWSPPGGPYPALALNDLTLLVDTGGFALTGLQVIANNVDVTGLFTACDIPGTLPGAGVTRRCPAVPMSFFAPAATLTANAAAGGATGSASVTYTIDQFPAGLTISPGTGTFAFTEGFTLSIVLNAPGQVPSTASLTLDGADVLPLFLGCAQVAALPGGAVAVSCQVPGSIVPPGVHTLTGTVTFPGGSVNSATAVWTFRLNSEP